jgi:hypothetical protein
MIINIVVAGLRRADLYRAVAMVLVVSALLTGCATQPPPIGDDAPGFWLGLVHGAIAPFSLIASLFYEVRVYAFPNSGWWYDFGFFLGIAGAAGGGATYTRHGRTVGASVNS